MIFLFDSFHARTHQSPLLSPLFTGRTKERRERKVEEKVLSWHKKRQMSPNGFLNEPIWNVEGFFFTYPFLTIFLHHLLLIKSNLPSFRHCCCFFFSLPVPTRSTLPLVALMISIWCFSCLLVSRFSKLHKRKKKKPLPDVGEIRKSLTMIPFEIMGANPLRKSYEPSQQSVRFLVDCENAGEICELQDVSRRRGSEG